MEFGRLFLWFAFYIKMEADTFFFMASVTLCCRVLNAWSNGMLPLERKRLPHHLSFSSWKWSHSQFWAGGHLICQRESPSNQSWERLIPIWRWNNSCLKSFLCSFSFENSQIHIVIEVSDVFSWRRLAWSSRQKWHHLRLRARLQYWEETVLLSAPFFFKSVWSGLMSRYTKSWPGWC